MPVRKAKSATPAKKPAGSAAPSTEPPAAPSPENAKPKKPKLMRDSFTIPKDEYAAIEELKLRAAQQSQLIKKSELLRAGLKLLSSLDDKQLLSALQAVPAIKTGRPAKAEQAPPSAPAPVRRSSKSGKAGKSA